MKFYAVDNVMLSEIEKLLIIFILINIFVLLTSRDLTRLFPYYETYYW